MKKYLFSLISIIPLLVSCGSRQEEKNHDLKIITPVGAPSLAFYNHSLDSGFETNSGDVSLIIASMVNKTKDIVVLPTNAGINAITSKKLDYKISSTITFGNLYVASTGNDKDKIMTKDDYIVVFQKNQFPDIMFKYVYGEEIANSVHYVSSISDAAKCLLSGIDLTNDNHPVDYVLMAEPALTNVLNKDSKKTIYSNIQELYKSKSGGLDMFQASIFVNSSLDKNKINDFLSSLEEDINKGIENPQLIVDGLNKVDSPSSFFGIDPKIIPSLITSKENKIGLSFKNCFKNKDAIDNFISLFGMEKTNEEIYFK